MSKIITDISSEVPNIKELHIMPCKIGEAVTGPIKEYFYDKIEKQDKNLQVSFRGRLLKGACMELPKNMEGYICRIDENEENNKEIVSINQFEKFTYWNHDVAPNSGDTPQKLMKYIKILNILNKSENVIKPEETPISK